MWVMHSGQDQVAANTLESDLGGTGWRGAGDHLACPSLRLREYSAKILRGKIGAIWV